MGGENRFGPKKLFVAILLVVCVFAVRYQYHTRRNALDVLEFRLNDVRLELPCTVADIRACGYQVNERTGACDSNDLGFGTLYITQDENGIVYELYTDEFGCDLDIYGNVNMAASMGDMKKYRKFEKDFQKAYGEPVEEGYNSRTYKKYKNETEYAYVVITDYYKVSRIGIVAEKR